MISGTERPDPFDNRVFLAEARQQVQQYRFPTLQKNQGGWTGSIIWPYFPLSRSRHRRPRTTSAVSSPSGPPLLINFSHTYSRTPLARGNLAATICGTTRHPPFLESWADRCPCQTHGMQFVVFKHDYERGQFLNPPSSFSTYGGTASHVVIRI